MSSYLYQYETLKGKCLYIGLGTNRQGQTEYARARNLKGHKELVRWMRATHAKVRVKIFVTDLSRPAARTLEAILIQNLRPPLNKNLNTSSPLTREAFYLKRRGRPSPFPTLKQCIRKVEALVRSYDKYPDRETLSKIEKEMLELAEEGLIYDPDYCDLPWEYIHKHFCDFYSAEDLYPQLDIEEQNYWTSKKDSHVADTYNYWKEVNLIYYHLNDVYRIPIPEEFLDKNKPPRPKKDK